MLFDEVLSVTAHEWPVLAMGREYSGMIEGLVEVIARGLNSFREEAGLLPLTEEQWLELYREYSGSTEFEKCERVRKFEAFDGWIDVGEKERLETFVRCAVYGGCFDGVEDDALPLVVRKMGMAHRKELL